MPWAQTFEAKRMAVHSSLLATAAAEKSGEKKGEKDSVLDQNMRMIFDDWAKAHKKDYKTEKERDERFHIFCSTYKRAKENLSKMPVSIRLPGVPLLHEFADLRLSEKPWAHKINLDHSSENQETFKAKKMAEQLENQKDKDMMVIKVLKLIQILRFGKSGSFSTAAAEAIAAAEKCAEKSEEKKGEKDSALDQNMRMIFDDWAKAHKKDYKTEKEREERFDIFCSTYKFAEESRLRLPVSIRPPGVPLLNEFADLRLSEMPWAQCL